MRRPAGTLEKGQLHPSSRGRLPSQPARSLPRASNRLASRHSKCVRATRPHPGTSVPRAVRRRRPTALRTTATAHLSLMFDPVVCNHTPSWGIVQRSGLRALNPPIQVRILVSQPRRRSQRPGSLKIDGTRMPLNRASASLRGATTTSLRYSALAQRQCTGLLRQEIRVRILGAELPRLRDRRFRGCWFGVV